MNTIVFSALGSALSKYKDSKSGNFAAVTALSATVIVGAIGAAVDISGAASEKSRLQNIIDSAALAASASGETKKNALQGVVDDIMAEHQDDRRDFKYKMKLVDDVIEISASAKHETAFMGIFGYKTIPINTLAGAPLAADLPVHMSLVIDTTNSMKGENLESLQDAAKDLIKAIEKNKSAGAKMAVVPFSNYVNVGLQNREAVWMNVPDDYTEDQECYMYKPVKSVTGCTTTTETRYDDGIPEEHETQEGCVYEYEEEEVEYCPAPREMKWSGCAGSRNAPLNITAEAGKDTEIPGAMRSFCGSELLPLTDNFADVKETIERLRTRGPTYLPTGLIWGWRSLSSTEPFATQQTSGDVTRALVFMTDGGNTMTQYDKDDTGNESYHKTIEPDDVEENEAANARMLAICDGIKNDGVKLYTIGYKLPAEAVGDSVNLRTCASSDSTAFTADNAKELKDAFKNIATSFSSVRLAY